MRLLHFEIHKFTPCPDCGMSWVSVYRVPRWRCRRIRTPGKWQIKRITRMHPLRNAELMICCNCDKYRRAVNVMLVNVEDKR